MPEVKSLTCHIANQCQSQYGPASEPTFFLPCHVRLGLRPRCSPGGNTSFRRYQLRRQWEPWEWLRLPGRPCRVRLMKLRTEPRFLRAGFMSCTSCCRPAAHLASPSGLPSVPQPSSGYLLCAAELGGWAVG